MTLLLYLIHVNVKRIPEGTGLLVKYMWMWNEFLKELAYSLDLQQPQFWAQSIS